MEDLQNIKNKLSIHNQEHLLAFYDDLSPKEQICLLRDLKNVDFKLLEDIRQQSITQSVSNGHLDGKMEPIPSDSFGSHSRGNAQEIAEWEMSGLRYISESKVSVLVLAGGQGTRLGVSYPKGMYKVGIPSGKSLYQVNAEKIKRLQELAFERTGKRGVITWYIMTSEATMDQTRTFFEEHDYFGLSSKNVIFFEQFTLPCIDFEGKIFLSQKHKIACAPDGNGGLYKALKHKEILDDMERRGIECTHVHCVDNILQKTADPVFIGFCRVRNAECGAKVVEKTEPSEAVGVVCKVDGVYQVVEYSEISKTTSEKRDKNGRLVFNAGNICNHYFTTEFLKNVCGSNRELPHHVAKKKIPHVDHSGSLVKPTEANGIKMEKFVFDVFKFAQLFLTFGQYCNACFMNQVDVDVVVILYIKACELLFAQAIAEGQAEALCIDTHCRLVVVTFETVNRDDEFSPLKNAEGASACSPLQSRWSLASLHHRQIVRAGGSVVDENGKDVEPLTGVASHSGEYPIKCEISPLLSYDGENLEKYVTNAKLQSPILIGNVKKNGSA